MSGLSHKLIARQKAESQANYLTAEEYVVQKVSYAEMIERGEPFLFASKIPLVYAFAPGTYWRIDTKSGFQIYGMAVDSEEFDEIEDVLDLRREGNIFARWFSVHAREGDLGYQPFSSAEQISYQQYMIFMHKLENYQI